MRLLRRARRSVAPLGSRRETVARMFYVPLMNLLHRQGDPHPGLRLRDPPTVEPWTNFPESRLQAHQINRILILKLDHLGDFITGLPAARQIREGFPDAKITLICSEWTAP